MLLLLSICNAHIIFEPVFKIKISSVAIKTSLKVYVYIHPPRKKKDNVKF